MGSNIVITTKTGDTGQTSLANGERLIKSNPLFDVLGTLDELNSWIGLVAADLNSNYKWERDVLFEVQETLFHLGAELARSPKTRLTSTNLKHLEAICATLQERLEDNWHTKFVLPGGTPLAAQLDITRTVCRRAERLVVGYAQDNAVSPLILKYLNRLSDALYLFRCWANQEATHKEQLFEV